MFWVYLLIVSGIGFAIPTIADEAQHFERGMHYIETGMYDQAIAEFQEILELNPEHSEAYCQLGAAYRFKDMLNEAADAYQKALTLQASGETYGVANLCLGMIYNTQGKFVEAEKYGKEAVTLLPDTAEAHYRLGDIYARRGKLAGAISEYQKAIQLDSDSSESYQGLGRVALMQNQPEKAIQHYHEAIQRDPYAHAYYYNLARAYRLFGQLEEDQKQMEFFKRIKAYQDTVQHHLKGLRENPTDFQLYAKLAETHLELSNLDAAVRAYKRATTLNPQFITAYHNLGGIYMQQGEFQKAIEAFQRITQLDEGDADAYVNLGWIYARQGKFTLAKSLLQDAIQHDPKLPSAYQGLAEIYAQQGDLKNGIVTYAKLVEIQPQASRGWLRLGVLHLQAKQFDDAILAFQKAIETDANSPDAYNNLAWLYADLDVNLEQAVGLAKRAVELHATASNFDTLAYVHYKNKQYQSAETAIRRALELDSQNKKHHQFLAKIQSARK